MLFNVVVRQHKLNVSYIMSDSLFFILINELYTYVYLRLINTHNSTIMRFCF